MSQIAQTRAICDGKGFGRRYIACRFGRKDCSLLYSQREDAGEIHANFDLVDVFEPLNAF